jgi:hypothetical protein
VQPFIVVNMKTLAMLPRWVLLGAVCLWPAMTQAAFETGSSLLAKCQHHGVPLPDLRPKAALQLSACYSYLAGVMDVLGLRGEICPRPAVNPPELARLFVGFARMQPPAILQHPALLFIQVAFERAFPCNE